MPTLKDALTATLAAEAVEASFVHAVAGIQMTENAYVSPHDDVAHAHSRFEMPDIDGSDVESRSESIAHRGEIRVRAAGGEEWVTLDMPRPALGPLAFLTLLYGADLERPVSESDRSIGVEISAARAIERVPDELRSTLDDILSARNTEGVDRFPEASTARLSIRNEPLHIAEMTVTTHHQGERTTTFALEVHPVTRRTVDMPATADDTGTTS